MNLSRAAELAQILQNDELDLDPATLLLSKQIHAESRAADATEGMVRILGKLGRSAEVERSMLEMLEIIHKGSFYRVMPFIDGFVSENPAFAASVLEKAAKFLRSKEVNSRGNIISAAKYEMRLARLLADGGDHAEAAAAFKRAIDDHYHHLSLIFAGSCRCDRARHSAEEDILSLADVLESYAIELVASGEDGNGDRIKAIYDTVRLLRDFMSGERGAHDVVLAKVLKGLIKA